MLYTSLMQTTLVVKLLPTPEQNAALLEAMERFNAACNHVADIAFQQRMANKYQLQKIVYREIREQFKLSAQMAVRAVGKVVEVYKRDKSQHIHFQLHGAMVYDERILSWKTLDRISILTLHGRELIPFVCGTYQAQQLRRVRGQADLVYRKGIFYLYVTVDTPEEPPLDPTDVLGVDLGIVNLATDSDGDIHSGAAVDKARRHYEKLRSGLQRVGTKSSRRRLKRLSGRERRFKRNTNHVISKHLVAKAHDTSRALALENLQGIRARTTVQRAQRSRHAKWAFAELRSFITYKAHIHGVPVYLIDPRNTSRTCPVCGCINRKNRPDQATFHCIACGYAGLADTVAAQIIRAKAVVMLPIVSDVQVPYLGNARDKPRL